MCLILFFGLDGTKVLVYFTALCILIFKMVFIHKLIYKNKKYAFYKTINDLGYCFIDISFCCCSHLFVFTKINLCSSFYAVWDGFCINNLEHTTITYLRKKY